MLENHLSNQVVSLLALCIKCGTVICGWWAEGETSAIAAAVGGQAHIVIQYIQERLKWHETTTLSPVSRYIRVSSGSVVIVHPCYFHNDCLMNLCVLDNSQSSWPRVIERISRCSQRAHRRVISMSCMFPMVLLKWTQQARKSTPRELCHKQGTES